MSYNKALTIDFSNQSHPLCSHFRKITLLVHNLLTALWDHLLTRSYPYMSCGFEVANCQPDVHDVVSLNELSITEGAFL